MPINFPDAPEVGATAGNRTWDGSKWCLTSYAITTGGFRNYIINGSFDIWNPTLILPGTNVAGSYYTADRFQLNMVGGTITYSALGVRRNMMQSTPPTELRGLQYYHAMTMMTQGAADDSYCKTRVCVEWAQTLAGQVVTLSFWYANSGAAGPQFSVLVQQNFGTGTNSPSAVVTCFLQKYTIATGSSAWKKYVCTFALPSIAGKTLGNNGDSRIDITWWHSAGPNYNAYTNSLGHQPAREVWMAAVQLEAGSIATPLERRGFSHELLLCQRYFESYQSADTIQISFPSPAAGGYGVNYPIDFINEKRTIPTMTYSYPVASNVSSATPHTVTTRGFSYQVAATSSGSCVSQIRYTAAADYA